MLKYCLIISYFYFIICKSLIMFLIFTFHHLFFKYLLLNFSIHIATIKIFDYFYLN